MKLTVDDVTMALVHARLLYDDKRCYIGMAGLEEYTRAYWETVPSDAIGVCLFVSKMLEGKRASLHRDAAVLWSRPCGKRKVNRL